MTWASLSDISLTIQPDADLVRITSSGQQDTDDVEFLFVEGNKVLFRSEAHKNVPSPPFCFIKGCISGPGNRVRLEALRDQLGWNSLEPDDEKKWVPILMH
ncbi:MAG: hypothetical protein WDW38_011586 [Sanguina aurantia]